MIVQVNTMCNSYQERYDLRRPDYSWFWSPVFLLSIPAMGRLNIPTKGRLSIPAKGRLNIPTKGRLSIPAMGRLSIPAMGRLSIPAAMGRRG